MDTIIRKIKSFPSLRSKKSSEPIVRSYVLYNRKIGPVEKLYVPAVLYIRHPDWQWTNLGRNLKTSTIKNLQQQQDVVDVLETLIDVMLEEASINGIEVWGEEIEV
jgi:hypothetical protein